MKIFKTLLLSMILLFSCTSARKTLGTENQSPLFGIVYDYLGKPLQDVQISEGNKVYARSDVDGRFVIPALDYGSYEFTATKEGYETVSMEFSFSKSDQILYLRMDSYPNLWLKVEEVLKERDFEKAKTYLKRCAPLGSDAVSDFLWAIYYHLIGDDPQALSILEQLIDKGWETEEVIALKEKLQYSGK